MNMWEIIGKSWWWGFLITGVIVVMDVIFDGIFMNLPQAKHPIALWVIASMVSYCISCLYYYVIKDKTNTIN